MPEFTLRLHSPRWGRLEDWEFRWTATGWTITVPGTPTPLDADPYGVALKKGGSPQRFTEALVNAGIPYPFPVPTMLSRLWEAWDEDPQRDLFAATQELADWITATFTGRPTDPVFAGAF